MIRTIPGVSRSLSFAFVRTRSLVKRDRFVRVRPRTSHSARCRRIFHKKWSSTHKISRDMHIQSSTKTSQYLKVPSSEKNYLQKALSAPRSERKRRRYFASCSSTGHFDARLHARVSSPREGPASCRVRVPARRSFRRLAPRLDTHTRSKKAELVKSMVAASARGVASPAQSRVARLSSRRATAVAPAAAPTRARRARSNTVEGTRGDGGSPASPPLARSPQALSNRRRARRFATGKQSAFSNSLVSNSPRRDGSHARRFARE